MKANLKQLIELAKESNISDPIDWEKVNLNEDTVYEMIGLSVIEMMHKIEKDPNVCDAGGFYIKIDSREFRIKP